MNWNEVRKRLEDEEKTSLAEVIELLHRHLTEPEDPSWDEDEVIFRAGLMATSLFTYDFSEMLDPGKRDRHGMLFEAVEQLIRFSELPDEFIEYLRRMVDWKNTYVEYFDDGTPVNKRFTSISEALEALTPLEPIATAWDEKEAKKQREAELKKKQEQQEAERPLIWREEKQRKRREFFIWTFVLTLGFLVLAALVQGDSVFFLFLFFILFGGLLLYAAKKKNYGEDIKMLPGVVAGLAILQVFFAVVAFMYMMQTGEYYYFLKARPVASIDGLSTIDDRGDVFVHGKVSLKNDDKADIHADDCAIYSDGHKWVRGPDNLLIEMSDGILPVYVRDTLTEHEYSASGQPRLILNRECTLSTCWKCLKIGGAVSVRGTLYQSNGNPRVTAEQVFSGTGQSHIGHLRVSTPFKTWSIGMLFLTLAVWAGFFLILVYYAIRWFMLWLKIRRQSASK